MVISSIVPLHNTEWSSWCQDKYTYLDFSTLTNLGNVLPAYMLNLALIALQNPENRCPGDKTSTGQDQLIS